MANVGYGAKYGILLGIVSIVLAGVFVYKSVRPMMRLRDKPPPEFFDVNSKWTPAQRKAEDSLARAYWQCAITISRGEYGFESRLPDEPVPGFSVDSQLYPSLVTSASAARIRYWRNLQKLWLRPHAWRQVYEWRTDWLLRGTNF